MKLSYLKGLSFGLTSGIITTLGMMVGLHSGTHSKLAVVGGIITIAIADAFSDALGIHISEESQNSHTNRQIWESTVSTFAAKFFFAFTFLIPVLLIELNKAIWVSIAWGLSVLFAISYWMAIDQRKKPFHVIREHVGIAILVIIITHYVGDWVSNTFGTIS
jgi:VIT1/CCC1 family predicted Fe2+/Mn2+ transporter